MKTMRFSAIASDLERKIRTGVFAEKMPTTLELAERYRCGKCTITNALRPLVQSGLLHLESRRGGLAIDRAKLRSGVIGVVGPWPAEYVFAPESEFGRTLARMRADGFVPDVIRYRSNQDDARSVQLFHRSFDGLIFTNSSLNEEVILALENAHIPFISCNRLPLHRRLNFIGFDMFALLPDLLKLLIARNYRTIGFMIPGRVEGFNQNARRKWINLKRSCDLPVLPCDRLLLNWRDGKEKQLGEFLACCRRHRIVLDAMIFWGGMTPDVRAMLCDAFPIPDRTLLVTNSQTVPAVGVGIDTASTGTLFAHAYEALREMIYAPSRKVIKRFIAPPEPWIHGEIPLRV